MTHAAPKETIIEPSQGWRCVPWRELWFYRDLLGLLVWRDINSRYKQTVLGPLWFVVQPLLTTLVFTVIFGRFAQIPTEGMPPVLFYLCGLLAWNYFAQTFQSTSTTLLSNAGLFGKVYFPRLVVPLSAALSNLVAFGIQAATFIGFYIVYKFTSAGSDFGLSIYALPVLPLLIIQVAAFSLGIGLIFAALTARFRDFSVLSSFVLQLWLYATPVIYSLSKVPESWRWLALLNPMTVPVEAFRCILLGGPSPALVHVAISLAMTAATFVAGLFLFQRAEKNFVDIV